MSDLFIHFYLDEDVSTLVAKLLQSRGFRATTTQESANVGRSDVDQLNFAAATEMAIITHNRADFEALAEHFRTTGQAHWGIVIAVRRPAHDIARRLLVLLDAYTADEIQNQ